MNIDDLVKKEENRIYAYIDKNKEFEYLDKINKAVFNSSFDIDDLYNFVLDDYNYIRTQGIKYDSKFYALRDTLKMMVRQYARANNQEGV